MRCLLFVALVSCSCLAAAVEETAKVWFPPLPVAEVIALLPAEAWTPALLHLPEERRPVKAYIQPADGQIRAKTSARGKEELYAPSALSAIELAGNEPVVRKAMQAMAVRDFASAVDLLLETIKGLDKARQEVPPHLRYLHALASSHQEIYQGLVTRLERGRDSGSGDEFLAAWRDLTTAVEARSLPEPLALIVVEAWLKRVARMDAAERERWQEQAKEYRLKLQWDEQAPEYLAAGRAAWQAGDHATAAKELEHGITAWAAFEDDDVLHLAQALLASGRRGEAAEWCWRLPAAMRARADLRDFFVQAGVLSPAFAPELLTATWIGGSGDQCFSQIEIATDGTVAVSSADQKLSARFAADGSCLGVKGDLNAAHDPRERPRNMAVRLTKVNPYDQSRWEVGYKQVSGILQQPYLISPHGWHWWKWWRSICEPKQLMADSRAIDLWFPNPNNFIVWAWSDGGNSSIDRDPRDLERGNAATKGYFGGGTKIMLGEQLTGEPLHGYNWPGRPNDACMDEFGNFFVAAFPRGMGEGSLFSAQGPEVIAFTPDLQPQALMRFGNGFINRIQVRGGLLVAVGSVGRGPWEDKKGRHEAQPAEGLVLRQAVQESPGGGADALVIIVRLWPQP